MRPKATSQLLQETERVIVTEWRLVAGAETGWHRHAHDYVVVCLTAGKLLAETTTGNTETELQFGQSYTRPAGVEHNIVNAGAGEFAFVEVELRVAGRVNRQDAKAAKKTIQFNRGDSEIRGEKRDHGG